MKKKLGILVGACAGMMMILGTAMAVPYPLQFDADAAGGTYSPQTIWGFDMEAFAKEVVPAPNNVNIFGTGSGLPVDFVTHQSLGADNVLGNGDTFSENITVSVLNGLGSPLAYPAVPPSYFFTNPAANLFIDLGLTGSISSYSDGGTPTTASSPLSIQDDSFVSTFSTGAGTMYVDGSNGGLLNRTFDIGETVVATFNLDTSGPLILTPSVFGGGAAAQVSFGFKTLTVNTDYFSNAPGFPDFLDSVNSGLHFVLTQNTVSLIAGQVAGLTNPDPDQIFIGFQETGFDAKFEAVPEPSTMFLLGTGLIGVALFGRKRLSKKV